jgi:hypothetical protein
MSVAKRKWGDALSARLEATQRGQALLRGVVHNLDRLVALGCCTREPFDGARRPPQPSRTNLATRPALRSFDNRA